MGTGSAKRPISIDGEVFPVRQNLWTFLKCLQECDGKPFVMWIDAICVDQNNISERNQQVQLMSDIYSNASRVCVWLGEDPLGDLRLFETLRPENPWADWPQVKRKIRWMRERRRQAAIKSLLDNPYWRRAWIVQEFILARRVLVMFGVNGLMSFRDLYKWVFNNERRKEGHRTILPLVSSCKAGIGYDNPFASHRSSLWELLALNPDVVCSDPRE